jgi:hypothetical protein
MNLRSVVIDTIGTGLVIAALLSLGGCGGAPCVPSDACDGQTFVRCVDDEPQLVDCAKEGKTCLLSVTVLASPAPVCGTIGYPVQP